MHNWRCLLGDIQRSEERSPRVLDWVPFWKYMGENCHNLWKEQLESCSQNNVQDQMRIRIIYTTRSERTPNTWDVSWVLLRGKMLGWTRKQNVRRNVLLKEYFHIAGLLSLNLREEIHWKNSANQIRCERESHSVVSNPLQPHGLYIPWNSPGHNTGVGSLSLPQRIFQTQGLNPGLLHCRWILYQLSY